MRKASSLEEQKVNEAYLSKLNVAKNRYLKQLRHLGRSNSTQPFDNIDWHELLGDTLYHAIIKDVYETAEKGEHKV